MLKDLRRLVLGIASVSAFIVLISSGCGGGSGGGGGGPVGPTAPTIADVAGNWSGTLTLNSATGCGCVGTATQFVIGLAIESTMDITQNGTAISGVLTSGWSGELCDFEGTVGSESLSAEATRCESGEWTDVECLNGNRIDLHWAGATLQASVFGNNLDGTVIESWDCSNSKTGAPTGTLVLEARSQHKRQ
jgi:hypothetical protein